MIPRFKLVFTHARRTAVIVGDGDTVIGSAVCEDSVDSAHRCGRGSGPATLNGH